MPYPRGWKDNSWALLPFLFPQFSSLSFPPPPLPFPSLLFLSVLELNSGPCICESSSLTLSYLPNSCKVWVHLVVSVCRCVHAHMHAWAYVYMHLLPCVLLCMCVCVWCVCRACVYMCVCRWTHLYMCIWKPELNFGCLPLYVFILFFKTGAHRTRSFQVAQAGWPASLRDPPASAPSTVGYYVPLCPAFMWMFGIWAQVLMFHQ